MDGSFARGLRGHNYAGSLPLSKMFDDVFCPLNVSLSFGMCHFVKVRKRVGGLALQAAFLCEESRI